MKHQFAGKTEQASRQKRPVFSKSRVQALETSHPILQLQRTIGNRGVHHLLESGELPVSNPGDRYEREAEQVADQVMRMSDSRTQSGKNHSAFKVARSATQIRSPSSESSGGGQPLSTSTRSLFEPRFGHDFSGVRVHTDSTAVGSAQAVNAQAFTVGRDIFFDAGRYAPNTRTGQHLLAHELTHVVQQSTSLQSRLQRFTAQLDGSKVFIVPEKGDTDRDLDRVLCSSITNRRIAGRTRIDVTECFPTGTIKAMGLGSYNCADFVRQAMGQTRPESVTAEWLFTGKLWEELLTKGFRVRSFGIVNKQGKIDPVEALTWKQLAPQMGGLVFMMGGVRLQKGRTEPDPKGDHFGVSWDHVGLFVVRSRGGIDYHLAKDGDENPIDLYHTGMAPSEWQMPGAYVKGTETLIAYVGLLPQEDVAAQERYIPRDISERYWKLAEAERRKINQETNLRFSEETGVTRRLDPDSSRGQALQWKWLRIRDEVTAQHLAKAGASRR